jgi:hypothetical protein
MRPGCSRIHDQIPEHPFTGLHKSAGHWQVTSTSLLHPNAARCLCWCGCRGAVHSSGGRSDANRHTTPAHQASMQEIQHASLIECLLSEAALVRLAPIVRAAAAIRSDRQKCWNSAAASSHHRGVSGSYHRLRQASTSTLANAASTGCTHTMRLLAGCFHACHAQLAMHERTSGDVVPMSLSNTVECHITPFMILSCQHSCRHQQARSVCRGSAALELWYVPHTQTQCRTACHSSRAMSRQPLQTPQSH